MNEIKSILYFHRHCNPHTWNRITECIEDSVCSDSSVMREVAGESIGDAVADSVRSYWGESIRNFTIENNNE